MKRLLMLSVLFGMLFVLNTSPAKAQFGVGVFAGYHMDAENAVIGAQGRLNLAQFTAGSLPLIIAPSYEIHLGTPEGFSMSQFDLNALYALPLPASPVSPYVGAGLGIFTVSFTEGPFTGSSSSTGLNAIGGAQFNLGNLNPFAQIRLTFADGGTALTLAGGLIFNL